MGVLAERELFHCSFWDFKTQLHHMAMLFFWDFEPRGLLHHVALFFSQSLFFINLRWLKTLNYPLSFKTPMGVHWTPMGVLKERGLLRVLKHHPSSHHSWCHQWPPSVSHAYSPSTMTLMLPVFFSSQSIISTCPTFLRGQWGVCHVGCFDDMQTPSHLHCFILFWMKEDIE